ncbi:glutathione S-transferase [Rhizobium sp. Root708]|nr:glutathione S-transferase [Rhizobium sp. Root708]
MLEELDIEYELRRYQRRADMSAPPELKKVHPLGKSPVIEEDVDGCQTVFVETGAICEYLVDRAGGRLGPPGGADGIRRYQQFLHYAEGSVMPVLFALLVVSRVPLLGRLAAKKIRPMLDVHLDYIEAELASRPWFAGDVLSAADIMMSFPMEAVRTRAGLDKSRPATIAWLERIHARPAYKRALAKGGTYSFAV